jgi:uncharacterized protein YodC (DUF2158 family)
MSEIVKGDVVVLKSTGPAMTVASIKNQPAIAGFPASVAAFCQWFDGDKPQEKWFDVVTLKHVELK